MKTIINLSMVAALAAIGMAASTAAVLCLMVYLTYANSGDSAGMLWGFGLIAATIAAYTSIHAAYRRAKYAYIRSTRKGRIPVHQSRTSSCLTATAVA